MIKLKNNFIILSVQDTQKTNHKPHKYRMAFIYFISYQVENEQNM